MTKIRPKDGVALPSVANPAAEDAVRRDWIEANISGGGGSKHIVQDEGVDLPAQARLNFVGTGVTASDDSVNGQTDVVIPGDYAPGSHVGSRDGHPLATTTLDGFMAGTDKGKLDALATSTLVQRTTNQPIADKAYTSISWDSEVLDSLGWFDPLSPTVLTVSEAASALLIFGGVWASSTTGRRAAQLLKNGGPVADMTNVSAAVDAYGRGQLIFYTELAAADQLRVDVWQDTGGSLNFGRPVTSVAHPYLRVVRVS